MYIHVVGYIYVHVRIHVHVVEIESLFESFSCLWVLDLSPRSHSSDDLTDCGIYS